MKNELEPIVGSWYRHVDKGQMFRVFLLSATVGWLNFAVFFTGFAMADDVSTVALAVQMGVPFTTLLSVIILKERIHLARITGTVEVIGTVLEDDLDYYQLSYGAGMQPDVWNALVEAGTETGRDLLLATWDTSSLSNGAVYTLRLTAVRNDKSIETAYVTVTIDHQPPTVTLTAPEDGASFAPDDLYITLAAEPEDNLQVSYVEFYVDDQLYEISEEWPYSVRWPIGAVGMHTVHAVAYDAAGNSAPSGVVTVEVSGGDR